MQPSAASPGIRIPPPLFAALAVGGGWLLQRRWPLPAPGDPVRDLAGWGLVAAAVLLMLTAMAALRRHRTTIRPDKAATALVQSGPYGFTRNPLYLSLALATPGLGFLLRAPWVWALWPLVILLLDRAVIAKEERHLAAVFGEAYADYRSRVRRWI